jgi:hydantoinase/carbamoylase family amidase
MATDEWVRHRLLRLSFVVEHDAAGSLIGRNTEAGASAFGLGSHIDSNRNGGPWDGTLGVVCALEIARLNVELGLGLPLRIFAFAEEEGSGFGEVLLGSRVMTGACTEAELRERIRDEDGTSFQEAAAAAGYAPLDMAASGRHLDGLRAWVEIHIEQARQLEIAGASLGNVTAIAGCIQGDLVFSGRADHAGATPMQLRRDAFAAAAAVAVALERTAVGAGDGTVATVGQVRVEPGQRTTVPARAILEIDARSPGSGHVELIEHIVSHAHEVAAGRGLTASWEPRQQRPPTPLDERVRTALRSAAAGRWPMPDLASGAVHDTMLIAGLVPAGMVFIPCEDGRSHTPEERADPTHAARAAEVVLSALLRLSSDAG